jgi:hypothetical protein
MDWNHGRLKHIEAEGCIINIREGLQDVKGRKVTSIEILPDDHFVGENKWKLYGTINNRVVQLQKVVKG